MSPVILLLYFFAVASIRLLPAIRQVYASLHTLFAAGNIAFGAKPESIDMQRVIDAAKRATIDQFSEIFQINMTKLLEKEVFT